MEKLLTEIVQLKNEKKYTEAIKKAKSGFKKYKDNCFNNEMYDCYIKQNKRKEAIKVLKQMLKYEPDDIIICKRLAYNYFVLAKYEEALKYYKLVIELEPLSSQNYFNAGSIYHYLNNVKKAYDYYYTALRLNPSNISALNNIGILYYENKNWDKAIETFNSIISKFPAHPEAYHHMGIIFREYNKDFELSELYIKKAIRLDPEYAENYYQLALTQYFENKIKDSILNLDKCLKLSPRHILSINLMKNIRNKFYKE